MIIGVLCIRTHSDPSDFIAVEGTLTFLINGNTRQCIDISIIDDDIIELGDECFIVRLSSYDEMVLGDPSVTTVCIRDDDSKNKP